MIPRRTARILAAMLSAAAVHAAPPPAPEPAAPVRATTSATLPPVPEIEARLLDLSPADPRGYFLLAEEVASESTRAEHAALARRLYILALETSRPRPGAAPGDAQLPSGVCLGLAAIARDDAEARWLRSLAATLAPGAGEGGAIAAPRWTPPPTGQGTDAAAYDLATALGLIRSGEGRRAMRLLDNAEVSALLEKYQGLLTPTGGPGGASRVRSLASSYPGCPECRNRRTVKDQSGVRLCLTCGGNPGPRLTGAEFMYQLRLESALLNGAHQSWSAQAVADQGAPLRDPDIDQLAQTFGVDPALRVYRDGEWRAP